MIETAKDGQFDGYITGVGCRYRHVISLAKFLDALRVQAHSRTEFIFLCRGPYGIHMNLRIPSHRSGKIYIQNSP